MKILPGTRLGPYEVQSQLGAGGMGVVYRARDTKLRRDVAIKVLPEAFTADAERLQRFELEAQSLAALNHPHIGAIYGFQEAENVCGLVLELVEGPTLFDRLRQGPLAIREALSIARQLADALEAAHEKGIIHRDLKPANVKVTVDGVVKVLDFGLAKALGTDLAVANASESPTLTAAGTRAGIILGTAAYMSPEQARGRPIDKRTDIWSFGCVLYEMLTGRMAFARDNVSDTLVAILEREPDWTALPEVTPPTIRRLLQRCLEKDAKRRLHDIADARIEIDDVLADSTAAFLERDRSLEARIAPPAPNNTRQHLRRWIASAVGIASLCGAVALMVVYLRPPPIADAALHFVVLPPDGVAFGTGVTDRVPSFAMSPDGQRLVFHGTDRSGRAGLWVRPIGSLSAERLAGTEGASFPFWSPDSTMIGFFAERKLKKMALSGGAPVVVADAPAGVGATWNRAGVIVFAADAAGPLFRVSDAGGVASPVTALEVGRQERSHVLPQFLPDGRHFIFLVRARPPDGGIYVAAVDTPAHKRLLSTGQKGLYAPPRHLLFLRDGTLMAQAFDVTSRQLSGDAVPVLESVAFSTTNGRAAYSVSDNGVLAYRASGILATNQLTWTDRSGKSLSAVGAVGDYQNFSLSPDQSRLAVESHDLRTGTGDLWLRDLMRGSMSRFTFDGTHNNQAVWSADGTAIVFAGRADGVPNLHFKLTSGSETDEALLPPGPERLPTDWSSDGRHILFQQSEPKTRSDIWVLRMPERKPFPYLQTVFAEHGAQFSPDGRWVSYVSNESGRDEVYVRPFPASSGKWPVSVDGGTAPRWRADGREIFYLARNRVLMSVSVRTAGEFDAGVPKALFAAQIGSNADYSVSTDGQRFLLNVADTSESPALPITVVLNWPAGLNKD